MRIKAGTQDAVNVKKCFLDGRDVTNLCCEADDQGGWAMLFETKDLGWVDVGTSQITDAAPTKHTGKVEFVFESDTASRRERDGDGR